MLPAAPNLSQHNRERVERHATDELFVNRDISCNDFLLTVLCVGIIGCGHTHNSSECFSNVAASVVPQIGTIINPFIEIYDPPFDLGKVA